MNYNKRCPYRVMLKDFDWRIKLCKLQNCEPVACPEIKENCPIYSKDYNTDTSAQLHRNMDEDIVRHFNEKEVEEAQDKEPEI